MKFFGPPTLKWRPCKISAKLSGNHVLMANIFKLHKYQTFGLFMELYMVYCICIIWAKSDLPIINSVCKRVWFTINGLLKILFCMTLYYFINIFDLHTFDNETTALLKFFEISRDMHFVSTAVLMIHSKCTVVHYANLNSSSINKSYLRADKYALSVFVFDFLFIYILKRLLSKTLR